MENSRFVLKLPTCSASVGHWICFSNSCKSELTAVVLQCLTIVTISHFKSCHIISRCFMICHLSLLHVCFVRLDSAMLACFSWRVPERPRRFYICLSLASAGFRGGGKGLTKLWPTSQPRHSRSAKEYAFACFCGKGSSEVHPQHLLFKIYNLQSIQYFNTF